MNSKTNGHSTRHIVLAAILLCSVALYAAAWQQPVVSADAANTAAQKLERIQSAENGPPTPFLTDFSEQEVNSYLYYEMAPEYPAGLEKIVIRLAPGRLQGTAEVDFDKARAARRSGARSSIPPMMEYLLRGRHTLAVEGTFSAIGGVGQFDLETVTLDGVAIPQSVVDVLIDSYIRPRHPNFDPERPFTLPYSIDRLQVLRGNVAVEVKPSAARTL